MKQALRHATKLLGDTRNTPSVCLVMPFEPQLNDKASITGRLKNMLAKAEARLLQCYTASKALPVLSGLQQLIARINFYHYKKSIALLATPDTCKLLYLDFPVTETVQAGQYLDIRDVIRARQQEPEYLAMVFAGQACRVFTGTGYNITCIKQNQLPDESAPGFTELFLQHMDQDLGLLLNACPQPVFVLGETEVLEHISRLTSHHDHIVGFIAGTFHKAGEQAFLAALLPELENWEQHTTCILLQRLQKAKKGGHLSFGFREVWKAATHRRGQLLVVEEDGDYPSPLNAQATNLINDAIEKVLDDGGEVEFVAPGVLKEYRGIALIEQHHLH